MATNTTTTRSERPFDELPTHQQAAARRYLEQKQQLEAMSLDELKNELMAEGFSVAEDPGGSGFILTTTINECGLASYVAARRMYWETGNAIEEPDEPRPAWPTDD